MRVGAFPSCYCGQTGTTAAGTSYLPCHGNIQVNATEALAQYQVFGGLAVKTFGCNVSSNGVTASSTVTLRNTGVDVNGTVSIPSSSTGIFTHDGSLDMFAYPDKICAKIVAGASGSSIIASPYFPSIYWAASRTLCPILQQKQSTSSVNLTRYQRLMVPADVSTESSTQATINVASYLGNAQVTIDTNGKTTGNTTIRFRLNGATSTGRTFSIAAGTTGLFITVASTTALAAGDLINWQTVYQNNAGTLLLRRNIEIVTINGFVMATQGTVSSGPSATEYFAPMNASSLSTTESDVDEQCNASFRGHHFGAQVYSNSISASSTMTMRKDGADSNLTFSITASTTGYFEDASNSDVFNAGSMLNGKLVTGGSGTTISIQPVFLYAEYLDLPSKIIQQSVKRAAFH